MPSRGTVVVLRAWLTPWRAVRRIHQQDEIIRVLIRAFAVLADQLEIAPAIPPRRRDHLHLVK
jgi:hypothetical protein